MQYYKFKQIILGLRNEYKKNEKALEDLKNYLPGEEEDIKNYNFYSFKHNNDRYVQLLLEKKQSMILKLLSYIQNMIITSNKSRVITIEKGIKNGDKKLIVPNDDIDSLSDTERNSFYQAVNNILSSEFFESLTDTHIKQKEDWFRLDISPEKIIGTTIGGTIVYPPTGVIYSSKLDQMIITAYEEEIMLEELYNIFNINLDKSLFNKGQREIIESSPDFNKELVVNGSTLTRNSQFFSFEDEDDKTVVLQRKK